MQEKLTEPREVMREYADICVGLLAKDAAIPCADRPDLGVFSR